VTSTRGSSGKRGSARRTWCSWTSRLLPDADRARTLPRGERPGARAWDRRDHWSAISGITVSPAAARPGLYFDLLPHNVHGEDVVAFVANCTVGWGR